MTTNAIRASIAALTAALTLTSCGSMSMLPTYADQDMSASPSTSTSATPSNTDALPTVEGTDGGDIDRLAAQTVADMRDLVDLPPTLRVVSWDSTKPQGNSWCKGSITEALRNAVACLVEPLIGWDRAYLRSAREAHGDLGVAVVIAHETGHIADRDRGVTDPDLAVLVREQRADCVAGAYIRSQRDKGKLTDEAVGNAFQSMLTFGDAPLKPGQSAANAHGMGVERITAMLQGFNDGAAKCLAISEPEVADRRTRLPLTVAAGEGDMAWTPSVVGGAWATASAFLEMGTLPKFTFAPCLPGDRPATICPDGSVYVTPESLTEYTDTIRRAATTRVGDGTGLGVLVNVVANRWLASQDILTTGEQAALRAACVVGITLARMTVDVIGAPIVLSAGDVDEALTEVLVRGLTTSDRDGLVPPSVPDRVQAFLAGVYTVTGPGACVTMYPESR
ncbi:putative lipoprotein peptidase LpqM [Mycobacteroides chelonae]|uniref:hypothetical protein n=1 Tax=Mycobacteroides chelonae TaxID=1774 RepID=UPI0021DE6A24|nr:hypothetical protein [Mycobacteroides chelonae]GLE54907.1 putative lipoprotein peptidase LpqM [Mycobacteroides chelonae]